jgi:methylated-DNA-[protein]-cysteine S-methyltransferase
MAWWTRLTPAAGFNLTVEASSAGIYRISFGEIDPLSGTRQTNSLLDGAALQLEEYFSGRRRVFGLPLDLLGTEFQKRVWCALLQIPFGETRTYGDVARAIGAPRAVRAVGAANGANPIAILVPCHRVIASDGGLCGYGGGLDLKRRLLEHERGQALIHEQ